LRERREDIPLLVEHFLQKYQAYYNRRIAGLSDMAMRAMMNYEWPGNVRELENVIERGLILTEQNETISAQSLFPTFETNASQIVSEGHLVNDNDDQDPSTVWIDDALNECGSMEAIENKVIEHALTLANGNVSEAARVLGISRPTLAYRIKKLDKSI